MLMDITYYLINSHPIHMYNLCIYQRIPLLITYNITRALYSKLIFIAKAKWKYKKSRVKIYNTKCSDYFLLNGDSLGSRT